MTLLVQLVTSRRWVELSPEHFVPTLLTQLEDCAQLAGSARSSACNVLTSWHAAWWHITPFTSRRPRCATSHGEPRSSPKQPPLWSTDGPHSCVAGRRWRSRRPQARRHHRQTMRPALPLQAVGPRCPHSKPGGTRRWVHRFGRMCRLPRCSICRCSARLTQPDLRSSELAMALPFGMHRVPECVNRGGFLRPREAHYVLTV